MKTRVQEIAENLYMITLPLPFQMENVNVFAYVDHKDLTLIDTGPNLPGTFLKLDKSLNTIGFSIKHINR